MRRSLFEVYFKERKVRTPSKLGTLGDIFNQGGCKSMESATENNRHYFIMVRVKTCGKSTR